MAGYKMTEPKINGLVCWGMIWIHIGETRLKECGQCAHESMFCHVC